MYYLLLESQEFVSYEQTEKGFDIIPTTYQEAYEFENWEEANLEKKRINSGVDEEKNIYNSPYKVTEILEIKQVTKNNNQKQIKLEDKHGNIFYEGIDEKDAVIDVMVGMLKGLNSEQILKNYSLEEEVNEIDGLTVIADIYLKINNAGKQQRNANFEITEDMERYVDRLYSMRHKLTKETNKKEEKTKKVQQYGILKRKEDRFHSEYWEFKGTKLEERVYSVHYLLEKLSEDGWILSAVSGDTYYLRREKEEKVN